VPNWPIKVGSAPPAAAAAGLVSGFAASGFAGDGLASAFGAFGDGVRAGACVCALAPPHKIALAARATSIRRKVITKTVPSLL
jgi:class 3 adenylate cyclase